MSLRAISIPGEAATLPAEATAAAGGRVGIPSQVAESLEAAVSVITNDTPSARILIAGSLYLAGFVLRENG
jgi:dihydrofolate synthase/folylpolyglutamate synthase